MNPNPATGESEKHQRLKALAFLWAREQGFNAIAPEVSFPHRRFRFDLAAFQPKHRVPEKIDLFGNLGVTAVFECKQSRSDLLKDCKVKQQTLVKLHGLYARKAKLEELLKVHLPHLSRGDELFPEFESYRWEDSGHQTYDRVIQSIRMAQNALAYKTKFDRLLKYRMANLHYLVAEPGLLETHEIPLGWGLLVSTGEQLELKQPPLFQETDPKAQLVFLQRVAISISGAMGRTITQSKTKINLPATV